MNMNDLLEEIGYTPKKKASSHGGEYCSPCPFCQDGKDRFTVWPNEHNENGDYRGGRYWCRRCDRKGDAVKFLTDRGYSYKEAFEKLKIEPKKRSTLPSRKRDSKARTAKEPPRPWKEMANVFVEWCHGQLISNQIALAMVQQERGFTIDSLKRFKIGFNPKDGWRARENFGLDTQTKEDGSQKQLWFPAGIVIPTFTHDQVVKVKIRRSWWKEGDDLPKYVELSGSKQCHSIYGDQTLKVALIVESEFDALLIQQFASDIVYCVALGGAEKSIDFETDQLLRRTPMILFCPDFDVAGKKAWDRWKKMFPALQLILTPEEKSAGDAHIAGVDLREWIMESVAEFSDFTGM